MASEKLQLKNFDKFASLPQSVKFNKKFIENYT